MLDNNEKTLIHSFPLKETEEIPVKKIIVTLFLAAFFGLLTGFLIFQTRELLLAKQDKTSTGVKKPKAVVGIKDKKTFKDHAEGILREGGIDGEGQFHLERPGGPSQNVYLTSTTVDLSQYLGKRVRVWGQTFAAQKAGWLMDVGLVEVL